MTKRQLFSKALIASQPIAAQLYRKSPEDPAAWTMCAKIAACAAEIADEVVTEWESKMKIWDEYDVDPQNLADPEYVNTRKHLDNGGEGGGKN
jgi:hypothetical protein